MADAAGLDADEDLAAAGLGELALGELEPRARAVTWTTRDVHADARPELLDRLDRPVAVVVRPTARYSMPSGPPSSARVTVGATRMASIGPTSTMSSSSLMRPDPERIT